MKKRIISLAAAAVFIIGTLAGCGNSSTQTTDKTASSDASSSVGDLVTVRDAVMTGQLDQYATEIGLWQGIFEKYGIDLQTTEFVAGINTIDAVVNGTADIGMMADYAAVNRLGNTLDATNLQIFSQISGGQSALSGGLYVDPKYADDPKSLDGSAGFMYQEGTVTYYYASKCIEYLGLDESKQNLINTDSSQTRLALIQKGVHPLCMPTVPKQSISKKPDGYRWQLPRKSVFRPDPTSCQPTNIFQKIQALLQSSCRLSMKVRSISTIIWMNPQNTWQTNLV